MRVDYRAGCPVCVTGPPSPDMRAGPRNLFVLNDLGLPRVILLRMNMMRGEVLLMRYFPMSPPIVILGLLGENRAQDMGGTNLYFREEWRTSEVERIIMMMGLIRLVMSSISKRAGITELGRATVSSA